MAVDTKNLEYRSVNLAKNEIRLLEIQAGSDISDPIIARLVNVKVTEDLEFIGLSALVGDLNDIEYMWINGCKVGIPANIGEALRNVRAVFRRDQSFLYQIESNSSSQTNFPPLSPRPPRSGPSSINSNSNSNSNNNNTTHTSRPRHKKTPGWLRHLLRGFQTLLPDQSNRGAGRETPLRVWLDCVCLDQRNVKEEQQRRAHMALAYGAAKLVVGWLGPKDETTDLAVSNLRTMDALTPAEFGEPGDREAHPENYGPRMDFLRPLGEAWRAGNQSDPTRDPREGVYFKASENFLMRPFFHRQWILEEVAMSQFPAFLMGDEIVSWMQVLKWNRLNEEFKERGCVHMPDDVKIIAEMIDIGTVHTLLEDFSKRRDKSDQRGLVKVSSSATSSFDSGSIQSSRPPTSQPRASKHLVPKYGL